MDKKKEIDKRLECAIITINLFQSVNIITIIHKYTQFQNQNISS